MVQLPRSVGADLEGLVAEGNPVSAAPDADQDAPTHKTGDMHVSCTGHDQLLPGQATAWDEQGRDVRRKLERPEQDTTSRPCSAEWSAT